MIRTIAVAAIAFGIAAFTLHRAALGSLEEPMLLVAIGTVFLLAARVLAPAEQPSEEPAADDEPQLIPERRRTA